MKVPKLRKPILLYTKKDLAYQVFELGEVIGRQQEALQNYIETEDEQYTKEADSLQRNIDSASKVLTRMIQKNIKRAQK